MATVQRSCTGGFGASGEREYFVLVVAPVIGNRYGFELLVIQNSNFMTTWWLIFSIQPIIWFRRRQRSEDRRVPRGPNFDKGTHWVALCATAPKSTKLRASAVFMDDGGL